MGALEAPQDKHGQEHRTGTSRAEQTTEAMAVLGALEAMAVQGAQEAMAELGAQEAMADGLRGLGLSPLGPAPTAGTLTTPPKKYESPWTRQDLIVLKCSFGHNKTNTALLAVTCGLDPRG